MDRKTCRLEDLAAKGRSIISGPFGSSIGSRFFQSEGIPVIRGNNLTTDHKKFVEEGFAFVSLEKAEELNAYALRDDILFTAAGTIGQVGIIPRNSRFERYVISNKQLRIRIDTEKADPDFVFYWLASPWIFETIQNRNTGSTVPLINLGTIRGLPVVLPGDVEVQKKVSALLGSIDAKIELNNRINAELEGMAKLLYDYWFVQFDFPMTAAQAAAMGKPKLKGQPYRASGGKMIYNETLKREIPEGWTDGKFSNFCSLNSKTWGNSDYPDSVNYVDLANTKNGRINKVVTYSKEDAPSRAQRVLRAGDTILGTVRPENCSFACVPVAEKTLTASTGFAVLTPNTPTHREFNYIGLTSASNIKRLSVIASGAAYPAVNPEVVAAMQIPIPPKQLIEDYHKATGASFDLIENNENQNQELTQLRDWLLPMLMNGQVRVE
ncbi:MAG: restriction endonuclease subunit S [Verrucomicrobiota bacterium]